MIRESTRGLPSASKMVLTAIALLCIYATTAVAVYAQETATPATPKTQEALLNEFTINVNALWTCVAAFLVFWMQAGFALVETGLTRAKNTCNILMKNLMDFAIGSAAYWAAGFGIMFGVSAMSGLYGTTNFLYEGSDNFSWAFFLFQTVFCATAATIVSGAMAERTKFQSYLIYSFLITLIVYPVFGKWAWGSLFDVTKPEYVGLLEGGGWLGKWNGGVGFADFAGSTVVHSVGGWCALAGAIVLGPRLGRYGKDGKVNPIPGHNIPYVALGVFILWLGWFGFNPGSTTAVYNASTDPATVQPNFAEIAVVTNLAGAIGAITALFTSWALFGKPDPSMTLNGVLAGLVAITAGCNNMSPISAMIIGGVAGILVVVSVVCWDKIRVDDPVGAVSVHAVNGLWGTLAVGLFSKTGGLIWGFGSGQIIAQGVGAGLAFIWAFPVSMIIFLGIKYTIGLRASEHEEREGLDITEHGMYGYPQGWVAQETTSSGVPLAAPQPAITKPAMVH
jgi:Amt family ammonium transporter